jgi:DNA processing protein
MTSERREKLLVWLEWHLTHLGKPEEVDDFIERLGRIRASPEDRDAPRAAGSQGPLRLLPASGRGPAASEELERTLREGVQIVCRGDPLWPANLQGLPGMPLLFFLRGDLVPGDARAVGIVGSRRPSPHGLRQAERFAGGLAARGFTVVSGLARGIDAAAHRGALAAGGRTIAVLGSGLGRMYPREHQELARQIALRGAVLTEFPWDSPPRQFHFPHRNRLLSALSLGVLVVEAGERSGSLITANWAVEQDRAVFALPGRADDPEARGGLRLIQDGAQMVLCPEEIVESLGGGDGSAAESSGDAEGIRTGRSPPGGWREGGPEMCSTPRPRRDLPAHLAALFREEDAWFSDRIVDRLARPPSEVLAELSRLEAEGILTRLPGGAYALA